ncbi:conserved unknown protein [Ectocarpus siliculosus]|uniref:FAD-binding PCMH-type domain-containing protein n=1 Tax=Ectocarpus siliculosus TaxID=2880 RepID=D7G4Z7_ECTSI|nr:conserved unknown protein [Ectocarpus siliculosus]|eukprot:CBJ33760.1 conserved unknown protein [Ectocarpus siliculosus]
MRVVSSSIDPHRKESDVSGEHTVLYPTTCAEVHAALNYKPDAPALVRSGRHAADSGRVDGTAAVVVNLRKFAAVEIDGEKVSVGAGATTYDLAVKLMEKGLFLPLDGNPDKSVLSNALSTVNDLVHHDLLSAFVESCTYVAKESAQPIETKDVTEAKNHVITNVVFNALLSTEAAKHYKMTRLTFVYTTDHFRRVVDHLVSHKPGHSTRCAVLVFSGAYGMAMFTVTTMCKEGSSEYTDKMIQKLKEKEQYVEELMLDKASAEGVEIVQLEDLPAVPPSVDKGKTVCCDIPGFGGEVFDKTEKEYENKATQYATTSYTEEKDRERMHPFVIGYPENKADVVAFVKYAIDKGKKVVARSGGHQYCGLSSGGEDTMLLSMDLLHDVTVFNAPQQKVMARLGPGARLTNLAAELKKNGVTIPHGECPEVCIGGHVQSGGFGHLLRSYGLALDHVNSFEIVLDLNGHVSTYTIKRPSKKVDEKSSIEDRIYWGVLGGGPGSFGVITEIEFECIKDAAHRFSRGYNGVYRYSKGRFEEAMGVVQRRTQQVVQDRTGPLTKGALSKDCDLMITAMSNSGDLSGGTFKPAVILVEMVHGNVHDTPLPTSDIERMEDEITKIKNAKPWMLLSKIPTSNDFDLGSPRTLSFMSNAFVRNTGMTRDGREYKFPYVKRLNCTTDTLTDEFVQKFIDLVHEAITTREVKLVFQMVMGGGAYEGNGTKGITSIPHRNNVIGIVFDVFYEKDGKDIANKLHKKFGALLPSFSKGKDIRMTWGSFGEIKMEKMWESYYGDSGLYQRLQKLKGDVDPKDVFHTPFTVQLDSSDGQEGPSAKKRKTSWTTLQAPRQGMNDAKVECGAAPSEGAQLQPATHAVATTARVRLADTPSLCRESM